MTPCRAGLLEETDALRLMEYMGKETSWLAWYAAMYVRMPYIRKLLYSSGIYPEFQVSYQTFLSDGVLIIWWGTEQIIWFR